jgi:protein-tyrosine phosphatase
MIISAGYAFLGPAIFQKTQEGEISISSALLLAPYRLAARLSQRYFIKKTNKISQITPNVYIGSFPQKEPPQKYLLDMTAEFSSKKFSRGKKLISCPQLDLLPPSVDELQKAAVTLLNLEKEGSVLVFCALGLSRSVMAVAAWLLASGQANTVADTMEKIKTKRPAIVFTPLHVMALEKWFCKYKGNMAQYPER